MRKFKSILAMFAGLLLTVSVSAEEWFVCLGSFKDVNNAKVLVSELKKIDIDAFIYPAKVGDNLYNRVLLDEAYSQIASARLKAAALEDSGKLDGLKIKGLWPCAADKTAALVEPVVEETIEKVPEIVLPPVETVVDEVIEKPVEETIDIAEPEVFEDISDGTKTITDKQIKLIGDASDFIGVKEGKYKLHIDDNVISFTYVLKKNKAFDLEEFTKNNPKPDEDGESYYLSIDDSFNYGSFSTVFRDKEGNVSKSPDLRIVFDMETDIDDLSDFLMFAPVGKEFPVKCSGDISYWGRVDTDDELNEKIEYFIDNTDSIEMDYFSIEWYVVE